jgi:hypothetical protein
MTGFTPAHDPQKIGCVACHLGNPDTDDKEKSHAGMLVIPGNLADAPMTCGVSGCHMGIDARVKLSLMNTMSGVVAVDKYFFGEVDGLDGHHDIGKLEHSAADIHLRNLCASCHLGQPKEETGPVSELSRGGGCNACHLNYSESAQKAHTLYLKYQKKIVPKVHPALSLHVSQDHCFGCHSRSGRLSTNYEGWHETQLKHEDVVGKTGYRVLEDERVFTYVQEDVHHARGMECIDCHGSYDVMGSGVYTHQEQAVKADCRDCHTDTSPETLAFSELNDDDRRILKLRGFETDRRFVVGKSSKAAIYNLTLDKKNQVVMLGKNSHREYHPKPPGEACSRGGVHGDITCSACHTAWAPQCISCHTSYDKEGERYDLLDRKMAKGQWIEKGSHYFAEYPALGVVDDGTSRKIKTFIPGMVMTLDQSGFPGSSKGVTHHRLYAPSSPHTIAAKGQGCKDCHNNPVVLGYGRGKMQFVPQQEGKEKWTFRPQFAKSAHDGLPEDAWIGFLEHSATTHSESDLGKEKKQRLRNTTRTHARSFTLEEQRKILRVGACLTCHQENSPVAREMLKGFEKTLKRRSDKCLVPDEDGRD